MMTKQEYAATLLGAAYGQPATLQAVKVFMPSNIALVKYWGKRQDELNLPLVSSLSYTLQGYGTTTRLAIAERDSMRLNGEELGQDDKAAAAVFKFLDLFRAPGEYFRVETENNIPTAAGVASSASGFAALLEAASQIKEWGLPQKEKSMLARLGSGSAARSFWPGLVLWRKGARDDGMDCYAEPLPNPRVQIKMVVLLLDKGQKKHSSREAMKVSLSTSPLAASWPEKQQAHLDNLLRALKSRHFNIIGEIVQENAELMHELIRQSSPSMTFDTAATQDWKRQVKDWQETGVPVYFTQDAGPNLKLLFTADFEAEVVERLSAAGIDYFTV
jgi:diphosphomevalonate decarboxylase